MQLEHDGGLRIDTDRPSSKYQRQFVIVGNVLQVDSQSRCILMWCVRYGERFKDQVLGAVAGFYYVDNMAKNPSGWIMGVEEI